MNKTIWLARLLYSHEGGLTRREIREKWREQDDRGRAMPESTFYDNCNYLESRYGLEVRREGSRYTLVCRSATEENVLRHLLGGTAADLGAADTPPGSEWLPLLAEAIDENRVLDMEYAPCDKPAYHTSFSPCFMRQIQGRAYVVGRSSRHGAPRTFAADRIRLLVATPQKFRRPPGLTADKWFAHSYGAYGGDDLEPERVVADLLDPDLAAYLRQRPLHPSQTVLPHPGAPDAVCTLSLEVALTRDFVGALLAFGSRLRVVAPETLRSRMAEEAKALAGLY